MHNHWQVAPIFGVPRVRPAAEYYRDTFGFTLDPTNGVFAPSPNEPDGVYAIVTRFDCSIHFQIRRGELTIGPRTGLERDLYIYVQGLDALFSELQQCGAKIIQPPQVAPYGFREIVVEDLNGYRLAFGERT